MANNLVYVYAGFSYSIPDFQPLPGQHAAANKDKHKRAAFDQYTLDQKRGVDIGVHRRELCKVDVERHSGVYGGKTCAQCFGKRGACPFWRQT
jgi:hypothetical protein